MFEQLFNTLNEMDGNMFSYSSEFIPADIIKTNEGFELICDLPGVNKEDVKISFEKGYLNINATRPSDDKADYVMRGRAKSFERSFYFDDEVDGSSIKAKMDNGVLQVKLSKKAKVSNQIMIE